MAFIGLTILQCNMTVHELLARKVDNAEWVDTIRKLLPEVWSEWH